MWKCKKCGEENEDSFDSCWSCGVNQDGTGSARDGRCGVRQEESESVKNDFKSSKENVAKSSSFIDYTSTYDTTRMIASFVSFIGWVIAVISVMIVLVSLEQIFKENSGIGLMGLFPSLAGFASGLFLVMSGQVTRALVNTADNTGQMLAVMKRQKGK
jgi:hypothetical protein